MPLKVTQTIEWPMRGFLMSVIKANNFTIGCELGTWRGGTTFFLLDYAPELTLHTVDVFEQQLQHEDYCDEKYDFKDSYPFLMQKAEKYGDRLIVHKGWTHEVAKTLPDQMFDFVFIDADHSYEGCKKDILSWWPKVKPGGLLIGHDTHLASVEKAVKECCKKYAAFPGTWCWVGSC